MIIAKTRQVLLSTLCAASVTLSLVGCGGEPDLNTETATYTPEERPLGVIAGDGGEYAPGAQVTLSGRLVGTVQDETIRWSQTAGTAVEPEDWRSPELTFYAPMVEAIESLKFQIEALDGDGEVIENDDGEPLMDEVEVLVYDPNELVIYTVDNPDIVQLNSVNLVGEGNDAYISGAHSERHTADFTPGASAVFRIELTAEDAGFYTLYSRFAIPSSYGGKVAGIEVNGIAYEVEVNAAGSWGDYRVGTISLQEGENLIRIGGGWDYYRFDSLSMIAAPAPAGPQSVTSSLVNPNASDGALKLMEFLTSHYGSATVSGQTEYLEKGNEGEFELTEFEKVVTATGDDAPAIVAFDLMDFSSSRTANGTDPYGMSEFMIAEHQSKNIILSALWHWNAPTDLIDSEEQPWHKGFYAEATTFDLAAALADDNSTEYAALMGDIDIIADELKKFDDAGIPILWRPLHEAEGAWFWWGAAGPEALKELWVILYDRLTNDHQLHNLIWVYTHAGEINEDWYPGDNYVDIVGYDGYDGNNDENPFASRYETLLSQHDGEKLIALTETGTIPNVSIMHENNAWWAFYITWNSSDAETGYGPDNQSNEIIDANYAQESVINLAEVPVPSVTVSAGIYDDFESAEIMTGWEFQVNWSPAEGLALSSDWAAEGSQSLSGTTQLEEGDDNIILQTYPTGGLLLDGVSTVRLIAHAEAAGPDLKVKLWAKDQDGAWADGGEVDADSGDVELTLDISAWTELSGLGVQFISPDNADSESTYYIDQVEFLE
ncbi:glycosyl hydrolase [Marinimicrobium sp. ARAG 43.8]|uniref:glycosyl hydrolase n=1 Tax=Marinimicrobium sp. ARAG 43.8 TaxID=3418719 RepID=UPI003CF79D28